MLPKFALGSFKVRYSICHTGSGFCNIERMGSVKISSSRRRKKWPIMNNKPKERSRGCRQSMGVQAVFHAPLVCQSNASEEDYESNQESQTFNRGRFLTLLSDCRGQQGGLQTLSVQVIIFPDRLLYGVYFLVIVVLLRPSKVRSKGTLGLAFSIKRGKILSFIYSKHKEVEVWL